MVQACGACVPGDPTDPATTMGAMISAEHRDRVKRVIDEASGGRLLHGGAIPTVCRRAAIIWNPPCMPMCPPIRRWRARNCSGRCWR